MQVHTMVENTCGENDVNREMPGYLGVLTSLHALQAAVTLPWQ